MNYELAKQLKESGFPQKDLFNNPQYYILPDDLKETSLDSMGAYLEGKDNGAVYVPSLSELIESCGDKFGNLVLLKDGTWEVCDSKLNQWAIISSGLTPEEAVANLFIEINKKK